METETLCIINFNNKTEKENLTRFLKIYADECPEVFGLENHPDCSNVNCVGTDTCWSYALRKKCQELDDEWS